MQPQCSQHVGLDGYELFRRAIMEHDEQAWAESVARYRPLLAAWASRCSASAATVERYNDLANHAFARAWAALSPARFTSFPNLAALLAYLRACVTATVIDDARSELRYERVKRLLIPGEVASPEQLIMDRFQRQEVWRIMQRVVNSAQERVILIEMFVYDLPPRAILLRHPTLFTDAVEVSTTKRTLCNRLKRCPELRQLYQEWSCA